MTTVDSLIDKVSLREILKSFLPALYFIVFLIPIINQTSIFKAINTSSLDIYNILLLTLFTILVGILISAIDLAKNCFLFSNILPTKKLAKEIKNVDKSKIYNSYFEFYDEKISSENKSIIEKYTNYYHFCFNMAIISLILVLLYFLLDKGLFFTSYALPIAILGIVSIVGVLFLLYGTRKIKYQFDSHLEKYKNSESYKSIIS